jgi:hypothetical protein
MLFVQHDFDLEEVRKTRKYRACTWWSHLLTHNHLSDVVARSRAAESYGRPRKEIKKEDKIKNTTIANWLYGQASLTAAIAAWKSASAQARNESPYVAACSSFQGRSNSSAHQLAVSIMEFPYTVAKNVKMKEEDPSLRIWLLAVSITGRSRVLRWKRNKKPNETNLEGSDTIVELGLEPLMHLSNGWS